MSAKTPRSSVAAGRRISGNSTITPVSLAGGRRVSASNTATPVSAYRRGTTTAVSITRRGTPLIATPECYVPISLGLTPTVPPPTRNTGSIQEPVVVEENSSVVVAVRVRPLSRREAADSDVRCVVEVSQNSIIIGRPGSDSATAHRFTYDHCLCSTDKLHLQYADQQHTYDTVARPLLDSAFEGFNVCLFAYGQTGSGKSYSIMGHDLEIGIIPRFGRDLFERIERREAEERVKVCVEISYFEIYNEKIHDLLAPGATVGGGSGGGRDKKAAMRVREHPVLGPYVEDLSTFGVPSYNELVGWLTLGNKQRATAATGMNDKSSRSHSVLTLVVTQTRAETMGGEVHEHSRKSRINIVDLAGSERVATCNVADVRVKEGISINQSLLTLGKVISGLADLGAGKARVFVPYRESVLTWLLRESLGGNSKTTMLATVSPANVHLEDTLNTLRYAHQARSIVNMARVNEDPKARLIRELIAEIEKLRGGQPNVVERGVSRSTVEADRDEVRELQRRLTEMEEQRRQEALSWMERLRESRRCRDEEADRLRRTGIAFQIDNKLPNLVNLNEDPQLAETLLYLLNEGDTVVGRGKDEVGQNIRLQGSLIQDNHCTLKHMNGVVTLVPSEDGHTYVNGHLISCKTRLNHGDRLVLGGNHYFRFNNPLESPHGSRASLNSKDFVFARSELLQVQDAKMKEELERARERTRQEMLEELDQVKREADFELSLQKHGFEQQIKELQLDLEQQNKEINEKEKNRNQLERKNRALQREVQAEKITAAAITTDVGGLKTLKTDYLTNIVQHLMPDERSMIEVSESASTMDDVGPFDLWLMLEQANSLCRRLKLPFTFRRHDRLTENGLECVVKVTDEARELMLELEVRQLAAKLDTMQQMVDGETNVWLFEGSARWMPDENLPLSFSPKVMESLHAESDRSNVSSFRLAEDASRTPTKPSDTSGVRRLIRRSLAAKLPSPAAAVKELLVREANVHHLHSVAMIDCFAEMSLPNARMDVSKVLMTVVELHRDARRSREGAASTSEAGPVHQLSVHLGHFLLHAAKLSSLFSLRSDESGSELSAEYVHSVKTLANLVVRLMQQIEGGGSDELLSRMEDAVYQCCQLIGQISTSMGISLSEGDDEQDFDIEADIAFHFLCGLELVTGNALHTAVQTLEDCQQQMEILAQDSFFGIMKDSPELVQSTSDTISVVREWASIYKEIHTSTSKERENDTDHLVTNSNQARQLVINFSSLIEAVLNLHADVEAFTKGENINFPETFEWIAEIRGSVEILVSHRRSDSKHLTKRFQECLKRIATTTHKTKTALRRAATAFSSKCKKVDASSQSPTSPATDSPNVVTVTNGHTVKAGAVVTRKIAARKMGKDSSSPLRLHIATAGTSSNGTTTGLSASPRGLGYVDVIRSPVSVEHSPVGSSRLHSTSVWSSTMSPGSREVTPAKNERVQS